MRGWRQPTSIRIRQKKIGFKRRQVAPSSVSLGRLAELDRCFWCARLLTKLWEIESFRTIFVCAGLCKGREERSWRQTVVSVWSKNLRQLWRTRKRNLLFCCCATSSSVLNSRHTIWDFNSRWVSWVLQHTNRAVLCRHKRRKKKGGSKEIQFEHTQHRDWWIAVKLVWGSVRKDLIIVHLLLVSCGMLRSSHDWCIKRKIHLINWQLSSIRYLSRKVKHELFPDRSDVESGQAVKSEKWKVRSSTLRILYELTSDRKKLARLSHVLNALSWPRRFYGCKL